MAAANFTLEQRFWSKVLKTETCWLWQRQLNNKGYGRFLFYKRTTGRTSRGLYAHRVAWLLTNGDIQAGMNVLHKCDTPACVNPGHLFLGTQADNIRDMVKKDRVNRSASIQSELTHDDVRSIRSDGRKHHIIAADYGLKRLAVWMIKARRTWKHVA